MLRSTIKALMYGAGFILTAPLWLPERVLRRLTGKDIWMPAQSQALSLLPGKTGVLLRNAYYRMILTHCPLHVCIQFGCVPAYSDIHIGKDVYVGLHCKLGLVDIGDGSIISDDVHVLSGARQHSSVGFTQDFYRQPVHRDRISIGRNCWIGAHAIVMADVGENCIVGAGAVVTRPIPPNSIAMGMPARVVRSIQPERWVETHVPEPEPACLAEQV